MTYFKQIGTNLVNKLTKSDGPPPDQTLETCKNQLKFLIQQINTVRKQFDTYTQCLTHTTESSCVLSSTISKFYEEADHDGTKQWVKLSNLFGRMSVYLIIHFFFFFFFFFFGWIKNF